jgi:hypothetical protein
VCRRIAIDLASIAAAPDDHLIEHDHRAHRHVARLTGDYPPYLFR